MNIKTNTSLISLIYIFIANLIIFSPFLELKEAILFLGVVFIPFLLSYLTINKNYFLGNTFVVANPFASSLVLNTPNTTHKLA